MRRRNFKPHPRHLNTTEECLKALNNGYIIENVTYGKVWLSLGRQKALNMGKGRNGRPFGFSTPEAWHIVGRLGLVFRLFNKIIGTFRKF